MADAFIPMFFALCISGVILLRPLTKRLGILIEMMASERKARSEGRPDSMQSSNVALLLERLNARLDLMEDRMEFTERLLETREPRRGVGSGV